MPSEEGIEARVAVLENQVTNLNARLTDVLTELRLQNENMNKLRGSLSSLDSQLGKLNGKLGGANLVIPALTAIIGVLATLVAVHV